MTVDQQVRECAVDDEIRLRSCEDWTRFFVEQGYQPALQHRFHTVFDSPGRPRINHVLHLLLTIFTFGLWAPVWLGLALFRPPIAPARWTLWIDECGWPHSSDSLHGPQYREGRLGHVDRLGRFRAW